MQPWMPPLLSVPATPLNTTSIVLPERNTGCGAVEVSSLDFFAAGSCGGSGINTVAKNSNAPRAPTVPFASRPLLRLTTNRRVRGSPVLRHRRGSSSEAWKAKARYLEGAKAGMPERTPGVAELGSPNGPDSCTPLPGAEGDDKHRPQRYTLDPSGRQRTSVGTVTFQPAATFRRGEIFDGRGVYRH